LQRWRILPYGWLDASENMAIDEAVFRVSQSREDVLPTLRFYSWASPAVSLGYFQDVGKEVDVDACRRRHIQIVRRSTGGKAILHEKDLSYAVIARDSNPLFTKDVLGTYRVISNCIISGLALLGIEVEIAGNGRMLDEHPLKTSCFSSPSRHELLVKDRKICGSAQLRSRGAFLQHGSILMEFDPYKTCEIMMPHSEEYKRQALRLKQGVTSISEQTDSCVDIDMLCSILAEGFKETLGIELIPGDLSPEEEELRAFFLKNKYTNMEWNMEGGCRGWM